MSEDASIHPAVRGLLAAMLTVLAGGVVWALVLGPVERGLAKSGLAESGLGESGPASPGLGPQVAARLDQAGVASPVTAVLLNFRAYDTLLEIAVLTIALLAIWSLHQDPWQQSQMARATGPLAGRASAGRAPAGRVLRRVTGILVPLMVLIAGYLLWAGATRPGGAFPAGAVAAAAMVLVLLVDLEVSRIHAVLLRVGIVAGLIAFAGVGLVGVSLGLSFLEYPKGWAGALIVTVESLGAASIALILAGIFAGSANRLTRFNHEPEAS